MKKKSINIIFTVMAYLLNLNLIFMFVPCKKSYDKPKGESCLVMFDSLKPQGLYSPWNSPGQNTGVVPFSRASSQPRDWTQVSHIAGRFFTSWATRETHNKPRNYTKSRDITLSTKVCIVKAIFFSNSHVWM